MKRKPTKRSTEGQRALDEFRDRWAGKPCWGCGDTWGPFEIHHIVGRDGILEYDDQRNMAHLCRMCHRVYHDPSIKTWHGRQVRIYLTLGGVLVAKHGFDWKYWDLAFLRLLAGPGDGRLNMEFGRGME